MIPFDLILLNVTPKFCAVGHFIFKRNNPNHKKPDNDVSRKGIPENAIFVPNSGPPLTVTVGYAEPAEPQNGRPNPYRAIHGWAKLPEGRNWGSTAGIDIDPDGVHV